MRGDLSSSTRRQFLASAGGTVLASLSQPRRPRAQGEPPIVIVGAGLAGLHAARLLQREGQRVVVLEARAGAGGRVRTIRAPFTHDLHGEAGAARFTSAHARVMRLAGEAGAPLVPFAPPGGAPLVATTLGRWRVPAELGAAGAALNVAPEEAGLSAAALLQRYVGDVPAQLKAPGAPSPDALRAWQPYDRVTWPRWLASRGASPGAITLMTLGGDSRELSALYVLRQIALLAGSGEFLTIEDGCDRLVRALADEVSGAIRFESPVVRVDHTPRDVRVAYLNAGRPASITASRVIFTNPFATLRDVFLHPELPAEKARAIAEAPYYPATRVLLQTRTRFWEADGLSGAARTDDPAEIVDGAPARADPPGLLAATIGRHVTLADGTALVGKVFPRLRDELERGVAVSWSRDAWSRGAFAICRPGQMTMMAVAARPEGRLHFAGEHASSWMGWMEGALESAERAAAEVLRER